MILYFLISALFVFIANKNAISGKSPKGILALQGALTAVGTAAAMVQINADSDALYASIPKIAVSVVCLIISIVTSLSKYKKIKGNMNDNGETDLSKEEKEYFEKKKEFYDDSINKSVKVIDELLMIIIGIVSFPFLISGLVMKSGAKIVFLIIGISGLGYCVYRIVKHFKSKSKSKQSDVQNKSVNKTNDTSPDNIRESNRNDERKEKEFINFSVADSEENFDSYLSGQLVAIYCKQYEQKYRDEYFRRLNEIGFSYEETEKLFETEKKAVVSAPNTYFLNPKYIGQKYFNLKTPIFDRPFSFYVEKRILTCAEVMKIWDEAESLYKNKEIFEPKASPEAWSEIISLTRAGGAELLFKYLKQLSLDTGITIKKIQEYSISECKMIHKFNNVNQVNECNKESISADNSDNSDSTDTSNNRGTKMTDAEGDNYIINIPKMWMLINNNSPKNQPVIGRDNMCYLFSDWNEATKFVASSNGNFGLHEISGRDFMLVEMQKLVILGIKGATIRDSEHTLSMNFNRGICNYLGEKFSSLAIRYLQTMSSTLKNTKKEEYLENLRKGLIDEINNSLFFVPCLYSDEDGSVNVDDNMLRVFPDSIRYLTNIARMDGSNDFVLIDENDNKTLLKDTGTMDFASMPTGKKLTMCKVKSGMTNKDYIAGFTTISELKMMFSNQRIGLATINDIKNLAESENELGIILNPFSFNLKVSDDFSECRSKQV